MGNSKIVRKGLSKYDFTAAGESTNRAGGREGENLQKQKVKMQKSFFGWTNDGLSFIIGYMLLAL